MPTSETLPDRAAALPAADGWERQLDWLTRHGVA